MMTVLIWVTVYMFKHREQLRANNSLEKHIGSFYEEIKIDSTGALLYTPIFIARRLLFCSLLLALGDYQITQVTLLVASTAGYIIYLVKVRPYENDSMNTQSIINESFVLVTCLMLYAFADNLYSSVGLVSVDTATL
jgi:hypothetical protein